ncbi:MAG TPA: NUDIX hydrolase [Miltoncostaeales bacterium]|nr:NUDIX hydrolase [Miltoncostaeales bacterium]
MIRSVADKPFPAPSHIVRAVVFQVRSGVLNVLSWQRGSDGPEADKWMLPGGYLSPNESLESSIRRHLATKVELREVSHIEQLGSWSDPGSDGDQWQVLTAYMGLVASSVDPVLPADTAWQPVDGHPPFAFDNAAIVEQARERLRAKLSYTNMGFALAPPAFTISQLRDIYRAALGHPVSATNLQRVLVRRGELVPTGGQRPSGAAGGRPASEFRFQSTQLEVTDQFAVLRPPREG